MHTAGSRLWLDLTRRNKRFSSAPAVALITGKSGAPLAEQGLSFDVYRSAVNADSSGILFLSRDGILHGYTDRLEPLVMQDIAALPEYAAQSKRLAIEPRQLRNHVRCVAITADGSRILITVVDEAWCYDTRTLEPLWGVRFPLQPTWSRVYSISCDFAGHRDIDAALRMMGLQPPVTPEVLRKRYRMLAMKVHPDVNTHEPRATRNFQDLRRAFDLLLDADLSGPAAVQCYPPGFTQSGSTPD
jgi:hypothetical protein